VKIKIILIYLCNFYKYLIKLKNFDCLLAFVFSLISSKQPGLLAAKGRLLKTKGPFTFSPKGCSAAPTFPTEM
jgi:hypothetical protein